MNAQYINVDTQYVNVDAQYNNVNAQRINVNAHYINVNTQRLKANALCLISNKHYKVIKPLHQLTKTGRQHFLFNSFAFNKLKYISNNLIVVIARAAKQSNYQQDCFCRSSIAMTYFIVFRYALNSRITLS